MKPLHAVRKRLYGDQRWLRYLARRIEREERTRAHREKADFLTRDRSLPYRGNAKAGHNCPTHPYFAMSLTCPSCNETYDRKHGGAAHRSHRESTKKTLRAAIRRRSEPEGKWHVVWDKNGDTCLHSNHQAEGHAGEETKYSCHACGAQGRLRPKPTYIDYVNQMAQIDDVKRAIKRAEVKARRVEQMKNPPQTEMQKAREYYLELASKGIISHKQTIASIPDELKYENQSRRTLYNPGPK